MLNTCVFGNFKHTELLKSPQASSLHRDYFNDFRSIPSSSRSSFLPLNQSNLVVNLNSQLRAPSRDWLIHAPYCLNRIRKFRKNQITATSNENSELNVEANGTPNLILDSGAIALQSKTTKENSNPKKIIFLETVIEQIIYNCRFFVFFAVLGALSGSLLCFFKGTMFVVESFSEYYVNCFKGIHTGKVILFLVEALDVYLVGTVMLIFGMGLYTLFIAGIPSTKEDRALNNSSLWGMFQLKERPPWMNINSLDEMKSKVGHVIVMVLLVGMFENSKRIHVTSSIELLAFAASVALAAVSLLLLHNLKH